jgi:predicted Zn-dependent protease
MRNRITAILIIVIIVVSCAKVPVTGRRQVNMLPEKTLMSMSLTNYRQYLSSNPARPETESETQMVKQVGDKISRAVEKYLKTEGYSKRIEGYKWEFNLVRSSAVNAWCMPGGKVVVYSGLLPVTQDEEGLAVVMGHEIAHAIARHGNERMSQQIIAQLGGIGLAIALRDKPDETNNIFLTSYGIGSTLGILKYSRTHESEADKMGLIFMAMAGYNPESAVKFWERMSASGGAKLPEILSTHPSDKTRIKELQDFMPEALNFYHAAKNNNSN